MPSAATSTPHKLWKLQGIASWRSRPLSARAMQNDCPHEHDSSFVAQFASFAFSQEPVEESKSALGTTGGCPPRLPSLSHRQVKEFALLNCRLTCSWHSQGRAPEVCKKGTFHLRASGSAMVWACFSPRSQTPTSAPLQPSHCAIVPLLLAVSPE